jgi:hypothetical protein
MKIFNYLSYITILLAIALLMYFYYLMFWPVTVIKANVQPYKVITPIIKVGGNLTYQVDACKSTPLMASVIRTFEDDIAYPSITSSNNIPAGCHKTNVTIPVPLYIPPGKYYIKLDAVYQINAFRHIETHFKTDTFQIVN